MTDNEMEYMSASMCGTADWCRGYNEAVTKANEIINRQNAEIERLGLSLESMLFEVKNAHELRDEAITNTIKAFAEQVKMAFYYEFDELIPSIMADKIDNLVKEMIGEQE